MTHTFTRRHANRLPQMPIRHALVRCIRFALLGCTLGAAVAGAQEAPPLPSVGVIMVEPGPVVLTTTLPGRIVASAVAEVRPQVNGIIAERLFEEGGHVEQGDPLYQIDPAVYEASVAQAKAAVAEARASFSVLDKNADRVRVLVERDASSQQDLDQAVSSRDVAEAGIAVAEAQLSAVTIELDRTTITAPLTGEIGLALTTRGALVTAGQADPLATIRNLDSVYVDITVSATRVLEWRREDLGRDFSDIKRQVTLQLADGVPYSSTGLLTANEPQVDEQTGSIVVRTQFPNPDKLLLPGMYVRVDIEIDTLENAYLIPQQAVSRDRLGKPTALVVNADDTVELRSLDVRQASGNNWIVVGGLNAGDRVVIEGQQKAAVGSRVKAEPADPGTAKAGGEKPTEPDTSDPGDDKPTDTATAPAAPDDAKPAAD